MKTIDIINRQSREVIDTWEVPEEIQHLDFGSDPITEAQRDKLIEFVSVTDLDDLRSNWGLRRLTASDVIGAFLRRTNQGREASDSQRELVEEMQIAIALSPTVNTRIVDKFLDMDPDDMDFNTIQSTINRLRRFIVKAKDAGHVVPWSLEQPNASQSTDREQTPEELAEETF